ncbi:MAG TPA: putative zinc-binding protein [Elusimicrobiales bacterium]|nr:putative zinc-binding protein [Elusimicrobiales bacterium]
MAEKQCACGGKAMMVFPCSGSADVGELADRAARMLSKETCVKMSCLAGVGGNISGFIASANGADLVIVLDGCQVSCAKKTLETHGVKNFKHITVTDCGFVKAKSPVTERNIRKVFEHAKELI